MMGNLGMGELMLIFVVVLLVFGAKRIPEIARGLGRGIREFKDATREISRELDLTATDHHRPSMPRPSAQPAAMPRPEAPAAQHPDKAPEQAAPLNASLDQPVH